MSKKENNMAFGKDPRGTEGIVPFGGGTMQQRDAFRRSKQKEARANRGGGAPYWKGIFKLPQEFSRLGRFIPGAYPNTFSLDGETVQTSTLEYLIFAEHFHGATKRGAICSAGPLYGNKKKAEPCAGCQLFWEDVRERQAKKSRGDKSKGPNRMSRREMFAFTWWDYGLWLKLPRTDDHGNVIINPNTNQPYTDWEMAHPNDPRQGQYEGKWGNLVAWPMSETHKDQLFTYADRTVRSDCATCGSQGTITAMAKVCGNPNCQQMVYDPQNSTLTIEQREKLEAEPYQCPHCGERHFIEEIIACRVCGQHNLVPKRANIFDVDLELIAVPSGDGKQTNLQILNRSNPRPIQVQDPEVLKNIKPMDLVAKFRPTPIEKQYELWGLSAGTQQSQQGAQGMPGMPAMQGAPQPQGGMPTMSAAQMPTYVGQPGYQQPAQQAPTYPAQPGYAMPGQQPTYPQAQPAAAGTPQAPAQPGFVMPKMPGQG